MIDIRTFTIATDETDAYNNLIHDEIGWVKHKHYQGDIKTRTVNVVDEEDFEIENYHKMPQDEVAPYGHWITKTGKRVKIRVRDRFSTSIRSSQDAGDRRPATSAFLGMHEEARESGSASLAIPRQQQPATRSTGRRSDPSATPSPNCNSLTLQPQLIPARVLLRPEPPISRREHCKRG
jgi:hypothetical protein